MKKTLQPKKLALVTFTVRTLDGDKLAKVNGAMSTGTCTMPILFASLMNC